MKFNRQQCSIVVICLSVLLAVSINFNKFFSFYPYPKFENSPSSSAEFIETLHNFDNNNFSKIFAICIIISKVDKISNTAF